jgi:hypothetical protein
MLLRRHGVRLRVDKITADGRNAICSACQVRRPIFRSMLSSDELIAIAHTALIPLHLIGLRPLVSALSPEPKQVFAPIGKNDPFLLCHALREAGTLEVLQHNPGNVQSSFADHRRELLIELRSVA